MSESQQPDWNPRSDEVLRDQLAAFDAMRERCPVAYSQFVQWSVFGHGDVTRILHDPETFSNAVSQHLNVPAGMDAPEHTAYRSIIDRYFTPSCMAQFEPICRRIAAELAQRVCELGEVEFMAECAVPFAVRGQCAFLGWPSELETSLGDWTRRNYEATLAQDRATLSLIAREFEALIDDMLDARSQAGAAPEEDVTASLMHETVWGRRLSNEEIASILRVWTVGEIGSIASSIGILAHFFAEHDDVYQQLRHEPARIPEAIDEILRIHGPLVSSRRVAKCPVEIRGRHVEAGERLSLNWVAANRDERVFAEPETFRWDRDPADNLLYGAGIHVCPGAPLARLEMRVMAEELIQRISQFQLIAEKPAIRAVFPASGYAALPLKLCAVY
jgi:cytochrome P450